jgi:diaminobutyrate acetyltransferase
MGWISAYRPPARPHELFVWQVAVSKEARGQGLGGRMLDSLLARPAARGVTAITTTVTPNNDASLAMFRSLARRRDAPLERSPRFDERIHFADAHATEWEIRIGPFPSQPAHQERPAQPEISPS